MYKKIKSWFLDDQRRLVALGTLLEYYDFFLFIHLGTLLSKHFFRSDAPQLWFDWMKWGGIYVITPMAALFFAHFGDKFGRKPVLVFSSYLVVWSAFLLSFLPAFESWEVWSTVLFVGLRFIQNAGIAGEPLAAKLYACEHMHKRDHDKMGDMYTNKTSWWLNVIGMAQDGSSLIALGIGWYITTYFPDHPYMWRLPFLFCLVGAFFIMRIRKKLVETNEFRISIPVKHNYKGLWAAIKSDRHFWIFLVLCTYVGVIFCFNIVHLSTHILEQLNRYSDANLMVHNAMLLSLNIVIGSTITWFAGNNRWQRKPIQLGMYVVSAIAWIWFYNIPISEQNYWYLLILQSLGQTCLYWDLTYGNILRNFDIAYRFRMCALGELCGRFISFVAIGFFIPYLVNQMGLEYGLHMILFCLVYAFIAMCFYKPEENRRKEYLKWIMKYAIIKTGDHK